MSKQAKDGLLRQIAQMEFAVPVIEWEQLTGQARKHYSQLPGTTMIATADDSSDFTCRIVTNYLRHEYTDYDDVTAMLDCAPGLTDRERGEVQAALRQRVLTAISETYEDDAPELWWYIERLLD